MLFCYEFFEYVWGFIFLSVQLRFEFSAFKYLENIGIWYFVRVFSAVWYQFRKNGITVKMKYNQEIIIASDRWYDELTCLISAYFTSDW